MTRMVTDDELRNFYKKLNAGEADTSDINSALAVKIARACNTPDEFINFATNQELPAIQLTPQEQEVLKGGWLFNIYSTWKWLDGQRGDKTGEDNGPADNEDGLVSYDTK